MARDQWKTYQRRSNDGRARAVADGIHGGDTAPFGYSWSERADGTKSASGKAKHGPLVPNEDAESVFSAFILKAEGASWRKITQRLGARSASNAASILRNRVYLGEARSGDYVKVNAHKAIVPEDLFRRVQRKLDAAPKRTTQTKSPNAPLAGILICSACGRPLTFDAHMKVPGYRCKNLLCTGPRPTATDAKVLEAVMDAARWWHSEQYKLIGLSLQMDEAILPELERALEQATAEVAEVEAMRGTVSPSVWAAAMEDATKKREDLLRQLAEVEASDPPWVRWSLV
jgi:hypothetical protein